MYPNQASYKVIHPGLIGTTKKLCYSQTGKLDSPDLKWDNFFMPTPMRFIQLPGDSPPLYWDNFFMPTPMRFIQLPGDSPPLYVSKSSFLQSDSSWFDWNDEEAVLFPNGKLESPDLKWDNFFMPTPIRFIQLPGDSPPLYVSKSSFLQSDSSWFVWNNEEAVLFPNWETGITCFETSYKVIHPGLIGTTKKLCYSQTGKLESPDLKVG
ncbi:hypothetical protein Bca101_101986 [Brassica carinata]